MKHYIKLLLLLFITSNTSIAQTTIDTTNIHNVDSATMYLTGTFQNYNPQRAFQINLQNANNGNAKAMNAVAMQYTKGLGVDSNFNLAAYWFNQAATNGYTKALINLGMLYKHNATDSNGYAITCSYFNQALQVNEPSAFFAMGYMYYKGLGCTQSYTSALNLFNQGIVLNQSNCMYFKGLCYKFGYGVVANNDSALFYIDSAARLGYKQANAELYNNSSTLISARKSKATNNINNEKQETRNIDREFISIAKSINQQNINGEFTGNILQYDYSGKKLIAQIPITLQVSAKNNIITGSLIFNNSQTIQLNAIQQGNQLIFSQTIIQQTTPNTKRQTNLVFKSANLQIETKNDTNYLTGTLQLFNTYTNEIDKPINIKLQQKNNQKNNTKPQVPSSILIFPNPANNSFTVSFNLNEQSPATINIYDTKGSRVYSKSFEQLSQGKQNILIPIFNAQKGIYIIKVITNNKQETTAFIKE